MGQTSEEKIPTGPVGFLTVVAPLLPRRNEGVLPLGSIAIVTVIAILAVLLLFSLLILLLLVLLVATRAAPDSLAAPGCTWLQLAVTIHTTAIHYSLCTIHYSDFGDFDDFDDFD